MASPGLRLARSFRLPQPLRSATFRGPARNASTTARPANPVKTGLYATVLLVSTGLFAVYYFDSRSAIHRYVFTPLLRHLFDAETGHKIAVKVLRSGLAPKDTQPDDEVLKYELWGRQLSNPLGLAAGFDKHAEAVDGLFDLGFSWVEIGSVTPKPQPGNPLPRVFHLPADHALINRYGFPSDGHTMVLNRLQDRIPPFHEYDGDVPASLRPGSLLAVNLGKNKSSPPDSIKDFVSGVHAFAPYADVLVVNVSSPNTPGLRGMQSRTLLQELLTGVTQARDEAAASLAPTRKPKVLLKIAPDLTADEVGDIAAAVRASGIDGVIVSNTTVQRPASLHDANRTEAGGLSGAPLKPYTLATLRALRPLLPASTPIIGCGGIASGADALEYARAGAAAVQLYTGFGYDGVGAPRRIKDELAALLRAEGTTWAEVVKGAVAEKAWKAPPPPKPVLPEEVTVKQLVAEAEELKRLLDEYAGRGREKARSEEVAVASVV
ncbi:dihydroorotate dehydrogenase 2 [Phanerochaete sordida]|uniref:Dihydroorotate dehydrogenase (quinone), mitochondrial n=1 Tax=Phanerochaete sordida TaxID=48140 RepID=A0A9P3GAM6_9APHY|nr:dihydroorotate dehydrogenase 2 [Phanerochaete sordida]